MGHEITNSDGLFVYRTPAWHNLGVVLPERPTREEAQAIAHPWEPESEPLYKRVVTLEGDDLIERYEEITSDVLQTRSDNHEELGVTSNTYTPVKNEVMYEIAEAIEGLDKGSVMYETGGSLQGGKKVWLMLKLAEPIVIKGDPNGTVLPYYVLQNSHVGSGAFRGQAVMDRVVCANTAQAADLEAELRGTEFVFRHTKSVSERIEEAKTALAGWRVSIREYELLCNHLAGQIITEQHQVEFIERFIPMPKGRGGVVSERVEMNIEQARGTMRHILSSPTCEKIGLTTYGLVQAAIEYQVHERMAHSRESVFQRAYLDRSRVIAHATELAKEVYASV